MLDGMERRKDRSPSLPKQGLSKFTMKQLTETDARNSDCVSLMRRGQLSLWELRTQSVSNDTSGLTDAVGDTSLDPRHDRDSHRVTSGPSTTVENLHRQQG